MADRPFHSFGYDRKSSWMPSPIVTTPDESRRYSFTDGWAAEQTASIASPMAAFRMNMVLTIIVDMFLYYYRSFSHFFAKIFSKAWSFRMISFPPREATTTAEPPETLNL
jgi:hypothetical protein